MTFRQKTLLPCSGMKNAGGMVYVPPTPCPRAAHVSAYPAAYPAAYVDHTGRAETKEIPLEWFGRREEKIRLVLGGGLT